MTYRECISLLKAGGIKAPQHEAQVLFSHFGGFSPAKLLSDDPSLDSEEIKIAVNKRLHGTPLQYITGKAFFRNEIYTVNENCLIPRNDTELLVEETVNRLPAGAVFLDLCTGSGCVAISVLASRKDTRAVAAEISAGALELASENADKNGVAKRISFIKTDVLNDAAIAGQFDAIVSNPPYIATAELCSLPDDVLAEPRIALDGGEDGITFYRAIIKKYNSNLRADGFFAFEIGYDQAKRLRAVFNEAGLSAEVIQDLGGNDRVMILRKT